MLNHAHGGSEGVIPSARRISGPPLQQLWSHAVLSGHQLVALTFPVTIGTQGTDHVLMLMAYGLPRFPKNSLQKQGLEGRQADVCQRFLPAPLLSQTSSLPHGIVTGIFSG